MGSYPFLERIRKSIKKIYEEILKFQTSSDVEFFVAGMSTVKKIQISDYVDSTVLDIHLQPRHIDRTLLNALLQNSHLRESDLVDKY